MKTILIVIGMLLALGGNVAVSFAEDGVLTWTPNVELDLAGYRIYFGNQGCTAQGPLAPLLVGVPAVPAQVGKVSTFVHTNLPKFDGPVCWEISAFDTANNESGRSNRVGVVLNTFPPGAPAGLSVAIQ